jgi:hypothetical protein
MIPFSLNIKVSSVAFIPQANYIDWEAAFVDEVSAKFAGTVAQHG